MNRHTEENYWSRFAASYDRDGEYVVGKRIIRQIKKRCSRKDRWAMPWNADAAQDTSQRRSPAMRDTLWPPIFPVSCYRWLEYS